MMTSLSLSIVAVALTIATSQQQATPPPPPPQTADAPAQGRGAARGDNPQRPAAADLAKLQTVEDLLEGMEISNADKFLQVDNQHYGEFIQRLRNLQKLRRQHQNQRQRLVMELRRLTNANPPVEDALLEAPTKRLDDFDKQHFQDLQDAYAKIDEVLNVRQRARFRLFEEQMEQRKLEILTRVLKSGAPAAPGRGGK
ncbi:MAG TPA: hypothetical protein VJN96_15710 [Vicinamibacterales bacterium]|nr:hypothetical protein [Vicinamibacterales bacterium]